MSKVQQMLAKLEELYPFDGTCFLHYEMPWQLLVATILSAQCTDDRVNQVTPVLFRQFPSLEALAEADGEALAEAIRSTGFFRTKGKHIQETARLLLTRHNGEMPSDIEALTALPGVGRKTANVVRGHIFQIPSVVVDTHVMRVSRKLGLTRQKDPQKIELELMKLLPKKRWIAYNQQIISHGRKVCTARSPKCDCCGLSAWCATRLATVPRTRSKNREAQASPPQKP